MPSFPQIEFRPVETGHASQGHGHNGSIKSLPSFSVSERVSRNASDADAFPLTNANLQIQRIERGVEDPGHGIGSVEPPGRKSDLGHEDAARQRKQTRLKRQKPATSTDRPATIFSLLPCYHLVGDRAVRFGQPQRCPRISTSFASLIRAARYGDPPWSG